MKKYSIISTNCDCCSAIIARTTNRWKYGPRCPGCNCILGLLSFTILAENIKAEYPEEAIQKFREE